MGLSTFLNTVRIIHRNEFVPDPVGIPRHLFWQVRKALNLFPFELGFSHSKILVENGRCSVSALVNCLGLYDPNNMNLLRDLLQKFPMAVLDIGANIGTYSLLASESSSSQILAFEPLASTFERLKLNLELNGRKNVRAFNFALGEKDSKSQLTNNPSSCFNKITDGEQPGVDTITIEVKRGDDFLKSLNFSPDFLKIDTEGYELFVLKGLQSALDRVKFLFVEISQNENEVLALLSQKGFEGPFFVDYKNRLITSAGGSSEDKFFVRSGEEEKLKELGFRFSGGA